MSVTGVSSGSGGNVADTSDGVVLLLLRLEHAHNIGLRNLGANLARGVMRKHDVDTDTDNALTEKYVANGSVDVGGARSTSLDHVAITELHALGTSTAHLARDLALNTLGATLHDVTDNTVASLADGEAVNKLELERLSLGDGAQTAVGNALSVQLDGALREVEPLLNDGGQLANATALLTEHILGLGSLDDNLGALGSNADFNASIALLGELTGEELVQLGVEDTIGNKLALLADLSGSHYAS